MHRCIESSIQEKGGKTCHQVKLGHLCRPGRSKTLRGGQQDCDVENYQTWTNLRPKTSL